MGGRKPSGYQPRRAKDPVRPVATGRHRAVVAAVVTVGVSAVVAAVAGLVSSSLPAERPRSEPAMAAPTSVSDRPAPPTAPTAPAAPAAAAPVAAAPVAERITMVFAGDLLPHTPLTAQAARYGAQSAKRFDFDPMLAPMAPIISAADVAICHMETPVAPDQDRLTGYPAFGGPGELVDAAQHAGYDGCSNASNHSLDRGRAGIAATLDRFDRDGLRHAGMARTAEEAQRTTVYDVKGVRVAHLSYSYGFNGYRLPTDAPWAVNEIDPTRIEADAVRARSDGADLVVVSLHWGTEYRSTPDQYQRAVADEVAASPDVDLIVGTHAHVVQPIDQIDGTYVIWGLGNQLANQREVPRSDGLTAIATATRGPTGQWRVTGVEGVPTWVEPGTFRVLPAVATLADPTIDGELRSELVASYDRTASVVLGDHTPGVTVAARPG